MEIMGYVIPILMSLLIVNGSGEPPKMYTLRVDKLFYTEENVQWVLNYKYLEDWEKLYLGVIDPRSEVTRTYSYWSFYKNPAPNIDMTVWAEQYWVHQFFKDWGADPSLERFAAISRHWIPYSEECGIGLEPVAENLGGDQTVALLQQVFEYTEEDLPLEFLAEVVEILWMPLEP